ncbi:MAG: hypothetical protein ACE5KE_05665 [Methanosarcinales archaeon]
MQKLKELNIYDKTSIIVTTDHGFKEGGNDHLSLPYAGEYIYPDLADPNCYKIWMVSNTIRGDRVGLQNDIAPTIYGLFGVDYTKFEPSFNGSVLGIIDAKPIWDRQTNPIWSSTGTTSSVTATLTKHDSKTKWNKKNNNAEVKVKIGFTIEDGDSSTIALKEVTDDTMGGTWSVDPKKLDIIVKVNGKTHKWTLALDGNSDVLVDLGSNGITLHKGDKVEVEMNIINTVTDHILSAQLLEGGNIIYQ